MSAEAASRVESNLVRRQGIDLSTGELLYELTAGSLEGDWDSRVSVRVLRERSVAVPGTRRRELRRCRPYLWLEGSVHKAMLGHNIEGGPDSFAAACRWFVEDVSGRISVSLPDARDWRVRRLDWAEVYELPYEGCEAFVWAMNQARYPRRKPARYGDESVMFPGTTTAVKIYHKGPEFGAHDGRRLRHVLEADQLAALQWRANEILRTETQVKARKLRDDFGELPPVVEVTEDYIKPGHDREISRILREGEKQMKTVRKHREVRDRLYREYGDRLAGVLFGTWMQFVTLGERETRATMKRPTYYRHRKKLKAAGISWLGSDVYTLPDSVLPSDFVPLRTDPRHVAGEHPTVSEKLAQFRAA